MRHSKGKKIAIAVITVICVLVVVFGIYKGIDYSRSLTEDNTKEKEKVLASVSEKKENKNTTKKTETKTDEKQVEENTEEENEETKKEEEKEFSDNRVGIYKVVSLKVKNKSYSKKEINTLRDSGYSLKLEMTDKGLANVSVLSINKLYEYTDNTFYDGENKIDYTYKKNKLSVAIDDYYIVFEKE